VVVNQLFSLPEYANARRISVFLSMPFGEISTTSIVRDALAQGKTVFVPYIHRLESSSVPQLNKVSVMDMLRLESMEDFDSLQPDKWGIPSLSQESVPQRHNCLGGKGIAADRPRVMSEPHSLDDVGLDMIVMPGLAFDTELRRLGHGKGYYDYFLNNYNVKLAAFPKASQKQPLLGISSRITFLPFPP
jgi:5-formyltetrahydrofolate cyclo-ligase